MLLVLVFHFSARGLSIQKVLGLIPSWILDFFFPVDLFLTLSIKTSS